jgi:tryptophan synthase alpha chain
MTYYNPVFTFGIKRFFSAMRTAGASGLLTVDLPIDEGSDYIALARKHELETIFFITPVTTDDRARAIIKHARGFIYYISVTGITGFRTFAYRSLEKHITHIKTMTQLPVCVGFGVHTSAQVKELGQFSDGVIVGSAIVAFIKHNHRKKDFLKLLYAYVRSLQRL